MSRLLPATLALAALWGTHAMTAAAQDAPPAPSAPREDARRRLHALFEEQWENWMRESPVWASVLGDHRYDDRWPDLRPEAQDELDRRDRAILERLRAIDPAHLSPQDRVSHALFERRVSEDLEERSYRTWLMPVEHQGGIQLQHELAEELRLETVADFDAWLARLRAMDDRLAAHETLMRRGMDEGLVPPRILMERVPEQLAFQLVDRPEDSPFWRAFEDMPETIPEAERARIAQQARTVIGDVVVPAYRKFDAFFRDAYLPAARATTAISALPRGQELYAYRVRHHTTTMMTPAQVHELGLSEVARIRAEMEAIIAEVGFEGGFAAFLEHLRTDPRYYAKDGQELLDRYRATCKQVDPELVKLFGRLPRAPYGVKPIPDESAPDTTTAYYTSPAMDGSRPGWYWVNLYKPEVRPLYEIEALSLHEGVPGHHLQIALAQELEDLPRFRRHAGYTAYVEGWGLYAESLGSELGLYKDPYSRFGRLTYEMWRAVRLVVDTGMHALGWDRQRAIEFFAANAAKTEHDIVNEIDRYISWPGQALAYKVGELKIRELRRRAEQAQGADFDVRGFHDVVLGSGAVSLDVLERSVDEWIEASRARGTAAAGQ